jgi:hypothetical protein
MKHEWQPGCRLNGMPSIRAHRAARRVVIALVTLTQAAACSAWRPDALPQAGSAFPDRMRLVVADGRRIELERVHIVNDSLVGEIPGRGRPRHAVALRDVVRIETRQFSAGRTIGLAAVGAGIVAAVVGVIVLLNAYSPIA